MTSTNYIQFYADKRGVYVNKLFSFQVSDRTAAFKVLLHFHCEKNEFRAIYYKTYIQASGRTFRYSDELIPEYNFFHSYDSSHYPSLIEACRDFEIYQLKP